MKLTFASTAILFTLCAAAAAAQTTSNTAGGQGGRHHQVSPQCKAAIETVCPGVEPGQGRVRACLKQHHTSVRQLCGDQHAAQPGPGASATRGAPTGRSPVAQAPSATPQ